MIKITVDGCPEEWLTRWLGVQERWAFGGCCHGSGAPGLGMSQPSYLSVSERNASTSSRIARSFCSGIETEENRTRLGARIRFSSGLISGLSLYRARGRILWNRALRNFGRFAWFFYYWNPDCVDRFDRVGQRLHLDSERQLAYLCWEVQSEVTL